MFWAVMVSRIKGQSVMNGTNIIIAATSIVLDAVLLTDDEHLLNLSWRGFRKQFIV